jgi:hypothetical protein
VILELGFFWASWKARGFVCCTTLEWISEAINEGVVFTNIDAGGDWKSELAREPKAAGTQVSTNEAFS